jgi:hypothetical protein
MTTPDPGTRARYRCDLCHDSGLVVRNFLGGTTPWPEHLALARRLLGDYPLASSATFSGLIVPSPCPHLDEPSPYQLLRQLRGLPDPCLFVARIVDPIPERRFFVGPPGFPGSREVIRGEQDGEFIWLPGRSTR